MNIKALFINFILISLIFPSFSQKGYKITLKANLPEDSVCYLGYYYGKFQYAKDTARFNNKGIATFQKTDKELERGVYFIVLPGKKHFDLIINNEQNFSITIGDTSKITETISFTGSKENSIFYEYNKKIDKLGKEFNDLKKREEKYKDKNNDSLSIIKKQLDKISDEMTKEKENFLKKNPNSFVSKVLLITKDPDIPDFPPTPDGKKDSVAMYNWYKANYFINCDLTDEAIVRTPVFHNRFEKFFTSVVSPVPDSLIKEIDIFMSKLPEKTDLYKYCLWYLTYHFETSQIMGQDAVFVHIVNKYYKNGKAFWLNDERLKKTIDKANKWQQILIGKTAPNMALIDTTLQNYIPLHRIKAEYLILIFWDPDCGHCKKEIEQLKKLYNDVKNEFDVKIYSVCIDTSMTKWKNKIKEKGIQDWINVNATRSALGHYQELYDVYSTPTIFLLDDKKTIIAKKLSAEATIEFMRDHRKKHKKL